MLSPEVLDVLRKNQSLPEGFEQMLEGLPSGNARAQLLSMLLSRRVQAAGAEAAEAADEPRAARVRSALARARTAIEALRVEAEELRAENEQLREVLETVADALGACRACFGEVPSCTSCRGRGRPGWRRPDRPLAAEWLAPALHWWANRQKPPAPDDPTGFTPEGVPTK